MYRVTVENHGSVVLLRPGSPEVRVQLEHLTGKEATWWGGALVCEPRYVDDILGALERGEG